MDWLSTAAALLPPPKSRPAPSKPQQCATNRSKQTTKSVQPKHPRPLRAVVSQDVQLLGFPAVTLGVVLSYLPVRSLSRVGQVNKSACLVHSLPQLWQGMMTRLVRNPPADCAWDVAQGKQVSSSSTCTTWGAIYGPEEAVNGQYAIHMNGKDDCSDLSQSRFVADENAVARGLLPHSFTIDLGCPHKVHVCEIVWHAGSHAR